MAVLSKGRVKLQALALRLTPTGLPWILLGFILLIGVGSAIHKTLTYDEDRHYQYGRSTLSLNTDKENATVMPITAFNAAPKELGRLLPEGTVRFLLSKFNAARAVTVVFSLGLAYLCYRWSKGIYGWHAGVLTLFLYAFEPNLIAHGRLVTTDLYAALGAAATVFTLWRYIDKPSAWRLILVGVALGAANSAKYTSLLLYPLLLVLLIVAESPDILSSIKDLRWRKSIGIIGLACVRFILISGISLLIINSAFLFNGSFIPISEYSFQSNLVKHLRELMLRIGNLPTPLPKPFLEGMDATLHGEREGGPAVYNVYYMFGEISDVGFKGYYLIATLFKVPLGTLALFVAAIVTWLRRPKRFDDLLPELFLLIPILYFGVYFNLILRYTKGIRHFLVVFPFALVFAGGLLRSWDETRVRSKVAVLLACAATAASVLSYFPHYISYFNELVLNRSQAYKILADSNLDWGQNRWYLRNYERAHPEANNEPNIPGPGTLIVPANDLVGIKGSPEYYRWIRENFEPIGTIAYSYLIYKVTPAEFEAIEDSIIR